MDLNIVASISKPSDENFAVLREVKDGLVTKQTLGYENSVKAFKICNQYLEAEAIQLFIQDCFLQMVTILTDQIPSKIGPYEKNCVEESLTISTNILLKLIVINPILALSVLVRLLDKNVPFYSGGKTYWTSFPGNPQMRYLCLKAFADGQGFQLIHSLLKDPNTPWVGAEALHIIMRGLLDVDRDVPTKISMDVVESIMKCMLNITEDQLKKESTDTINNLIRAILLKKDKEHQFTFYSFWLDHTYKMLNSQSIVLKLFAWEQLHDLIREAMATRPIPKRYAVLNAGNSVVNGIYDCQTMSENEPPRYVREFTAPDGSKHILTLFRCAMRSKQKWWFISEADIKCPGTDKDIDYYQHKSTIEQEREPPCYGWITAVGNSGMSPGVDPPPILERLDPYIKFDNIPDEQILINRLQTWVFQNNVLDHVFGQSMHRELILRSSKLLILLAEMKSLKAEHIQAIWKASLISHESEVIDEIHTLLITVSQYLSEDLFNSFISLIQETLDSSPDEQLHQLSTSTSVSATANSSNVFKVIQFISKIDLEGQKYFRNLSSKSSLLIVTLIWNAFKYAGAEATKSPTMGSMETLLSMCLAELREARMSEAFIMQCIRESLVTVESACAASSPGTSSTSNNAASMNVQVSRVIYALHFLMHSVQMEASIVEALETDGIFTNVMMNEVTRYVSQYQKTAAKASSKSMLSTSSIHDMETSYKSLLLIRIDILRCYYGTSKKVKMPMKMVESLSELLMSQPAEREPFFSFLRQAGTKQPGHHIDAAYDLQVCSHVFSEVICSATVDWTTCGDAEFQCFNTYFNGLQAQPVANMMSLSHTNGVLPVSPTDIGLDTLWRITLCVPSPQVAKSAISLLLKTYDELKHIPGAHHQLLERVFNRLGVVASAMQSTQISVSHTNDISRCIDILQNAISRFKGNSLTCHAVRGRMSRIKVTVRCPRNVNMYYSSQYDSRHTDKYNYSSFITEVHPMHTLLHLKHLVAEHAEFYSISKVAIEKNGKLLSGDSNILSSFDIVDGTELIASMTTVGSTVFDEEDESNLIPHCGSLISSTTIYFECLLNLIESFESLEQHEASKMIWDLIQLIPTQPDMLNAIQIAVTTNEKNCWDSILTIGSISRATYNLQIIDSLLQPAPELLNESTAEVCLFFKRQFVCSGGFLSVLNFFVSTSSGSAQLVRIASSVALHILHFCLFNQTLPTPEKETDVVSLENVQVANAEGDVSNQSLLPLVQTKSSAVVEKLLQVANYAAAADESDVVSDALMTITYLMQSPGVASQLTGNPQAKTLLTVVLRSESKKVRGMAGDFAIQIGQSQPIVFEWLVSELQQMDTTVSVCDDVIRAIISLIEWSRAEATLALGPLAEVVRAKLMAAVNGGSWQDTLSTQMLLGCLQILTILVSAGVKEVLESSVRTHLVKTLLTSFLLAMPSAEKDKRPVCETPETRQAAFAVLTAFVKFSPSALTEVILQIQELSSFAAENIMDEVYNYTVSFDMKKANIDFVGLKNQGCTCYLNSLIQQLFMCKSFREAVMSTPLKESHRTTLWHRKKADLVGKELMIEWVNSCWEKARVLAYHVDSGEHTIVYESLDGKVLSDEVRLMLHEGRFQKETGRVRLMPDQGDEPLTEREESAERVLEQLQRTFCFMKLSKRRFFDPKPFVEACRSLNLNFNVYHQNDASEFCDNLLDRLETSMKGKSTGKDIWKAVVQRTVFGGKMLYQKIPTDCATYQSDKRECGHWRSTRRESFLKVELIIRGKDKIEDSLDELVKGELMDGDNKIMCDACNEKKATVRRTCFGVLSNLLILHLKRFDLDFQTFETVKLNNRIAFPTSINVFKYTKEGMEAEEKRQRHENGLDDSLDEQSSSKANQLRVSELQYEQETDPNAEKSFEPLDYEYELQGVLVHAGIAQGGHYYSFIRDKDYPDRWYRFDDEDVTPFHPDHIPYQCFGGTVTTTVQGVSSMIEEDRSANALMLFFDKVRPIEVVDEEDEAAAVTSVTPATAATETETETVLETEGNPTSESRLIDGYQAFENEVWEANREHVVTTYLLEGDLHNFVRNMIGVILNLSVGSSDASQGDLVQSEWASTEKMTAAVLSTTQFGIHFLLDIVLHCRERTCIKTWLSILKNSFVLYPDCPEWLVRHLLSPTCEWLKEFLLTCNDPLARATFVQLLAQAVSCIAPKDPQALVVLLDKDTDTLNSICMSENPPPNYLDCLVMLLLNSLSDLISEVPYYTRYADELFLLVRELSSIPSICNAMLACDMVGRLAYFAIRDRAPESVRQYFQNATTVRQNSLEHTMLLPSVFEALAALLGVPQSRKVNLLEEQINYSDPELTAEVKVALTTIFHEVTRTGSMDMRDLIQYWDRIFGNTQKMTNMQAKAILDRYDTNTEGRLTLDGFLRRYADVAMYNPKSVWQDLTYFGFQNDLKRTKDGSAIGLASTSATAAEVPSPLVLPESSRKCLMDLALYEAGLDAAEGATVAIAQRVSTNDDATSCILLKQALKELYRTVKEWVWSPAVEMILGFVRVLVTISDQFVGMRIEQLMQGDFGLVKVIMSESRNPGVTHSRGQYDDYDSNRSISSRYLEFIQDIRNNSEVIANWINEQAASNSDMKWLKQQLQPAPAKTTATEEETELARIVVVVEGAGTVECNGNYQYLKLQDNAALFQRKCMYDGKQVVFNLYRCRMNDNTHRWFISITPGFRDPGTSSDIDFYTASSVSDRVYSLEDRLPPRDNWSKCKVDYCLEPCPVISWRNSSLSPATYDDRDDTLAVVEDDVNDDSFSSFPGTPVGEGEAYTSTSDGNIPFASI